MHNNVRVLLLITTKYFQIFLAYKDGRRKGIGKIIYKISASYYFISIALNYFS